MNTIMQDINKFMNSTVRDKRFQFTEGFFLEIKKHIKNGIPFLEIHTSGYDGTVEAKEGIDWISWTLYDYAANGIL